MGDKRLTAALSIWNIGLFNVNSDTLRVLDGVELMSYDSFDERGNHSTFLTITTLRKRYNEEPTPKS